jgi:hypothetical protein
MFVSNALAMRDAISICVIGGVSVCPYASHTPSTRGGEDGGDGAENEGVRRTRPSAFLGFARIRFRRVFRVGPDSKALTRRP